MAITIAGLTPNVPLRTNGQTQYNMVITYDELVRQNLKNLLMTAPGERVMDINFGVGFRNYLFEPNNQATYSKITTRIYQQVARYMPFLKIDDVVYNDSDENIDNSELGVTLYYTIVPLSFRSAMSVAATREGSNL